MQNQIKPQVEASMQAAFELANLSFAQAERITELTLEQAKVNAELAQDQLTSALEVKDPTQAIALLKAQMSLISMQSHQCHTHKAYWIRFHVLIAHIPIDSLRLPDSLHQ